MARAIHFKELNCYKTRSLLDYSRPGNRIVDFVNFSRGWARSRTLAQLGAGARRYKVQGARRKEEKNALYPAPCTVRRSLLLIAFS